MILKKIRHPPVRSLLQELKLKSKDSLFVLPRLQDWDTGRQAEILRMFLASIGYRELDFMTFGRLVGNHVA